MGGWEGCFLLFIVGYLGRREVSLEVGKFLKPLGSGLNQSAVSLILHKLIFFLMLVWLVTGQFTGRPALFV